MECSLVVSAMATEETIKTSSACHAAMNPGQKPKQWPPTANRGEERKNLQHLKHQVPICSDASKLVNVSIIFKSISIASQ